MKKLKSTLQIAQTECGLCCVKSILEYFGYESTISELRSIKEPGRDGLNMRDLRDVLETFGVSSKIYKVNDSRVFKNFNFPIIVFWKKMHFICVEKITRNSVIIMDPSIGRINITFSEFLKDFSGYILLPKKDFKKFKKKKINTIQKWNKKYIWPKNTITLYFYIGLVSLLIVGVTLSIPIATQYCIDKILQGSISTMHVSLGIVTVSTLMLILYFIRTILSIKIMYNFSWNLINGAFSRILSLPAKYFSVRTPGEIAYRISAMRGIQDILGPKLVQSILDLVSTLLLIGYTFYVSVSLGVSISFIVFGILLFLFITNKKLVSATDKEIHEGSSSQSIQLDALVSINNIKLGGYKPIYLDDWRTTFKKLLAATSNRMKIQEGYISSILLVVQTFIPLIILLFSLKMVTVDRLTIGEALSIQTITSLIFVYATSIFNTLTDLSIATKYVELADDIFEYPKEDNGGNVVSEINKGNILIKNLDFQYTSDSQKAIRNINLEIKENETVALVGISGSGKTTLGKLISTLFIPTEGTIHFDNIEYRNYDLNHLRKYIGYIPQEAHLHNRTIMENLLLGTHYTEKELIDFCESMKFLDFIKYLPMGYQTIISEMGGNLSGGQRQRIHIARVLLQNPKILIMDEATSSLDNLTQSLVYEFLNNKISCTKIIIAHRLETILKADKIIVLENGEIVEQGTHNELINKNGKYVRIYQSQ